MQVGSEFCWRLARRCRELSTRTNIERVREHLLMMAADLEAQGQVAEREAASSNGALIRTPAPPI